MHEPTMPATTTIQRAANVLASLARRQGHHRGDLDPMPPMSGACTVVLAGRCSPRKSRYAVLNVASPAR